MSTPHPVNEAVEYFGETLKGNVVNPATSQLFAITSEAKELGDGKKERYHLITAKILWIMKRSRPYLDTAVYFLCPRVQCPTEEYWGGIRRFLNYLKATKNDKRIMGSDDLLKLETCVDASYVVHEDMRGHTGGCMSCGFGIIHGKESKQKLNTKSTTESEVVAVSEYVPYKIHMINFFGDKAMFYTKRFFINKTKVQLRWRRTAGIRAKVILGTFLSGNYLLSIEQRHQKCST